MKILSLRFQNLNSLEGEWSIDFTHPDYAANGIFAITGPTGAGKSTILDAICLALYGRTPRLGKITENFNEIMSRRRGECSAELLFECAGGRFRVHWSQHRARKKAGAKLQEPRHEIAEADSGQILESARSRTELEVIKISGMSFDQFTRSILLAQGEFAAFLEADVEDRAGLLEQISGTEIYSRISMAVHGRKNAEWEKLRQLNQELAQCPALAEEDAEALGTRREAVKKDIATVDTALAAVNQAAARLETVAALEKKRAELDEKRQQLENEFLAFQPDRARLAVDRAAALLDGPHSRLKTLRQQALEKAEEAGGLAAARPPAENALAQAEAQLAQAAAALEAAHSAESAARPVITQARELDMQIGQITARIKPLEQERLNLLAALAETEKAPWSNPANSPEAQPAPQASLEDILSGRELAAWHSHLRLIIQKRRDLEDFRRLSRDLEQARNEELRLGAALSRDSKILAELETAMAAEKILGKSLAGQAEALEALHQLRLKVESLEERRKDLAPGQPCPLCGAHEHPWADPALVPTFDEIDAKLRAAKVSLKECEKKYRGLLEKSAALREALKAANGNTEKTKTAIAALEAEQKRLPFADSATTLDRAQEELACETAALEKRLGWVAKLFSAEQSRLLKVRRELLGSESPSAREAQLAGAVKKTEEEKKRLEESHHRAARDLDSLKTRQAAAAQNALALSREAQAAEEFFKKQLPQAGLADEAAYLAAALTPDERLKLAAAEKNLAEAQAVNIAGIRETQAALAAEAARQTGNDKTLPQLREESSSLSEERDRFQAALGVIEQKLKEHQEAANAHQSLRARHERQKNEFDRFSRLHELIGSADGKKYRHFAQGLTFEVMMAQANKWLSQMNDRYLLVRDSREPLELSVADNYQAGEIRSTKNLSGGERFIVSLALALGLSKMAGQNVRVDSLFLDEGFGALDEDSLDTALEALSGLREHGKLIGVISHVPALTDRIPIQIKINRLPGGLATLSGPGVKA